MDFQVVDELQLITGIDIPVTGIGITIHQPRIREIAMLGEQNYFTALSVFGMTRLSLKIKDEKVTNWMIFNESLNQKIEDVPNTRTLIRNFVQLFLMPKVNFGPRSIIIDLGGDAGLVNIDEENFDKFQAIICAVGGQSLLKPSEENFKPINAQAAAIAEKMKKARKRLAAQKPQSKSKGFLKKYVRAVAIGTSNSMDDIANMTILQLDDTMKTYLAWESYDLEVKARLAGSTKQDAIIHWIMAGEEDDPNIGKI